MTFEASALAPEKPHITSDDNSNNALIVVDSYNDFLSKKGSAWPLIKATGRQNHFVENMKQVVDQSRASGLTIAFAPHHRFRKDSHADRRYLHPAQHQQKRTKSFPESDFGGMYFKGLEPQVDDIVSSEHACSSGFAGTDLHQKLKKYDITHLILVGCISNSCIEATARSAVDLGYYVSVVTDAMAAFSPVEHDHAINNTLPLIAHNVISTKTLLEIL